MVCGGRGGGDRERTKGRYYHSLIVAVAMNTLEKVTWEMPLTAARCHKKQYTSITAHKH